MNQAVSNFRWIVLFTLIPKKSDVFVIFRFYAPEFEEVGGAYCFWVVCLSVCLSVHHAFLVSNLEEGPLTWMLPLHLHVNQKSINDDDDILITIWALKLGELIGTKM